MKMEKTSGFTMIELIATIVLSAIAMAALLPLLSQTFLRSFEPRQQLRDGLVLHTAMEELVARNTNDLEQLRQFVGVEGSTYRGLFTVQANRYITFVANAESVNTVSNNLLKITLRTPLGESLTRLFTEPL
jgi:prepilin-type N-terminal cleavage/methylation domain-containing protein